MKGDNVAGREKTESREKPESREKQKDEASKCACIKVDN